MDAHAHPAGEDADASGPATAAAPGLLIDGRYRLDQVRADHEVPAGARAVLWRATDLSLERPVAVTVVSGATKKFRAALVAAATRASTISDAHFLRVFDVGHLETDPPSVWIAGEWVDAPTLTAAVRGEPLPVQVATEVVRHCAEALAAAEANGCSHGWLHPDQVLLPPAASPRISGLATAAVLHGVSADPAADARGLGGLLFAALTGRWPLPGWSGLPGVDARTARGGHPRAVHAGIPGEVDATVARAITGGFDDAHEVARAVGRLPSQPLDAPPAPAPAQRSDAVRRWAWRVVPPVVVAAIALTGWEVGSELGRVPLLAREPRAVLPPANETGPHAGKVALVWRAPPTITSFDPGGDGVENPDSVGLAVDRDTSTEWTTDTYRGNPHLGGLKPGVGLLLDLHRPRAVSVAELVLSAAGSDVEIRAGDTLPTQAADLPLVASSTDAPVQARLTLTQPTTARYWLVWFTSLPPDHGGYRIGVAEVALLG